MQTVLVFDTDFEVLSRIADILDRNGYQVVCTCEPQRAVSLCRDIKFDIIVCNVHTAPSEVVSGFREVVNPELFSMFSKLLPHVPVVALVDQAENLAAEAITSRKIVTKPIQSGALLQAIGHQRD